MASPGPQLCRIIIGLFFGRKHNVAESTQFQSSEFVSTQGRESEAFSGPVGNFGKHENLLDIVQRKMRSG